ncbi:hypothetical protein ABTP12_18085, partial [Acinetobacter baumannii]
DRSGRTAYHLNDRGRSAPLPKYRKQPHAKQLMDACAMSGESTRRANHRHDSTIAAATIRRASSTPAKQRRGSDHLEP